MEYNTTRNDLTISEYGRNIQKMIEYILTIESKEKRTRLANFIVEVMSQMHPQVKETTDYKQKMWDHLHIISNFNLDVECPFPIPSKQALAEKPQRVPYQNNNIKFKQYGKNLELVIAKAIELEDGEEKDTFIKLIANHLKKSYLNWNRDSVNDELIIQHLELLSGGKLKMPENARLLHTGDILARNGIASTSNYKKKKNSKRKDSRAGGAYHRKG
jgi:hypothetical protein